MRILCSHCHRPDLSCFCAQSKTFATEIPLGLLVHPMEVKSTVGTAWILRRSISNLRWLRTNGLGLDQDPQFLSWTQDPGLAPILLFPGAGALELDTATQDQWQKLSPSGQRPFLIVLDGTWSQAKAMLKRSAVLRALPRVSFAPQGVSEYGFKRQPSPACLSSVETVHRILQILARRGWLELPHQNAHDQMIEIFREMVRRQIASQVHNSLPVV